MSGSAKRIKVAILGGGAAGCAAAYELTATPELRERFEVTVHTAGWRLGGKGASGRDASMYDRIEEHGLHVWFGFYANSIRMLDECLAEIGARPFRPNRPIPWRRTDDAFMDKSQLLLNEPTADGGWVARCVPLPSTPPTGRDRDLLFWGPGYLRRGLKDRYRGLSRRGIVSLEADPIAAAGVEEGFAEAKAAERQLHGGGESKGLGPLGLGSDIVSGALLGFARGIRKVEVNLRGIAKDRPPEARDEVLALAQGADLLKAVAAIVGRRVFSEYADGSRQPFDHLNEFDLRAVLTGDVAGDGDLVSDLLDLRADDLLISEDTSKSAFIRVLYDLAFAYREGDASRPDVGAGVGIENLLNIALRHRGRLMRKMKAGMGDVVFAPIYEALRERQAEGGERSVHFEFFDWVTGVRGSDGEVREIRINRQAGLRNETYDPFEGPAQPRWPNAPVEGELDAATRKRLEDLRGRAKPGDHPMAALEREANPLGREEGESQRVLKLEEDFDAVVFAISPAALEQCAQPIASSKSLKSMIEASDAVMTQAVQLWLERDFEALGWPCTASRERISGGHAKPYDTCADMSHLLDDEPWPEQHRPASIAYLCGVFDHREASGGWLAADRKAGTAALAFVQREFGKPGSPFWEHLIPEDLVDPADGVEWERFAAQYWRANSTPWERYVTSHAGSIEGRLRPDGRNADGTGTPDWQNLALAGDWTYSPINAGSFEGAVMSGMAAAHSLVRRFGGDIEPRRIDLPVWRRS